MSGRSQADLEELAAALAADVLAAVMRRLDGPPSRALPGDFTCPENFSCGGEFKCGSEIECSSTFWCHQFTSFRQPAHA